VRASDDAGFELLEHTADVGIRAWGSSPPQAFERAARGLVGVMGVGVRTAEETRRISVGGGDPAGVLVAFLNDLIWLHESSGLGFAAINVVAVSEETLLAEVALGALPDPAPEGLGVKAATYHQVHVGPHEGGGVEVRVYLDV
jgi:SHS2 domain-containing protein